MSGRLLEEIRRTIERGRSKDAEKLVRQALEEGLEPSQILRLGLLPAMRNVGNAYRAEEADIPRILSAARGVRLSMDLLEPYLEKTGQVHIGQAIIGTVEGDLHEVGKNLVAIMFRSSGFDVIDLGVDVTDRQFLRAVRENPEASIVCISSLLTTALPQMRRTVRTLRSADKTGRLCIMVGGGSVNEEVARQIGADVYTDNAVDAAEAARHFLEERKRGAKR